MVMKKINLIISIDTECDKGPGWKTQFPLAFRGVHECIGEVLQPLFERNAVKPTYLLSPEVIQDQECVNFFAKYKNVELGTHLHSEFIEPQADYTAEATHQIQARLTPSIEHQKLINLTNIFISAFGYSPKSFRSGRFGISQSTLGFLDELGYLVDSSVTPFTKQYFDNNFQIDHWGAPIKPYHPSIINFRKPGNLSILEVPVSISITRLQKFPYKILKVVGCVGRFRNKLESQRISLRPIRNERVPLIDIANEIINHWPARNIPVLNVMTHNVEYIAGLSPKSNTNEEAESIFHSLRNLLESLNERYHVESIGLSELSTK
jgi:hypothetical protein